MKTGKIVEYIEHRKIVCAVVLKVEKKKLRILAESNREIKLSNSRVFHESHSCLNLSMGRIQLVELVKQISLKRCKMASAISVKLLWNKTSENRKWLSVETMSKLCFSSMPNEDQEAAVIRACFNDKLYFKFKPIMFLPNSKKIINELNIAIKKEENEIRIINVGSEWIIGLTNDFFQDNIINSTLFLELKEILSSFYIHGKMSPHYRLGKKILDRTSLNSSEKLFNFMVKIGVWNIDENLDIIRFNVPSKFSQKTASEAKNLETNFYYETNSKKRVDLTDKFTITIDGSGSLDFDDALSIEKEGENYLIGIHISDVSHHVKKNSALDKAAFNRISSIYTPDGTLPMLPTNLSEGFFSLIKGKTRLAISTIVRLTPEALVIDYEVCSSIVNVDQQLSYSEANQKMELCKKISMLYTIAEKLREIRIKNGATQIKVPELNVKFEGLDKLKPILKKTKREAPSRVLVEEMMILSNWIIAQFLNKRKVPAIFRSQPDPIKQVIKNHSTNSLFHNWMQKKMFRRVFIKSQAERHCVLGLNAYVTASSPIRKYADLVTQRQIKTAMKIDQNQGYSRNDINKMIKTIVEKTTNISKIQSARIRYWIFKYLEKKKGKKESAIVLQKRYGVYNILLMTYMLECALQDSSGITLKPKDVIQVRIQYISARNNIISVSMV